MHSKLTTSKPFYRSFSFEYFVVKLLHNLTISPFHATSKFVSWLEAMDVASFWIENNNFLQTFLWFAVVDIKLACWLWKIKPGIETQSKCHPRPKSDRSIISGADLRGARGTPAPPPPPWVQILSISCSFWGNLAHLCVGPPWRVGAPTSGKSWIRHWIYLN